MKLQIAFSIRFLASRSRKGAWIEIKDVTDCTPSVPVAPVRERGLKYNLMMFLNVVVGRSREGAWIEMIAKPVTRIS